MQGQRYALVVGPKGGMLPHHHTARSIHCLQLLSDETNVSSAREYDNLQDHHFI
jgi:hypothetical protein